MIEEKGGAAAAISHSKTKIFIVKAEEENSWVMNLEKRKWITAMHWKGVNSINLHNINEYNVARNVSARLMVIANRSNANGKGWRLSQNHEHTFSEFHSICALSYVVNFDGVWSLKLPPVSNSHLVDPIIFPKTLLHFIIAHRIRLIIFFFFMSSSQYHKL